MDMLNALIKAKNDLTNIHDIVHIEQCGGEQFYTAQFPALPSIAKKTLWRYANDSTKISQVCKGSGRNNALAVVDLTLGLRWLTGSMSLCALTPSNLA
jgi:hypothetical protein